MQPAYIVDAVRSPVGKYGGKLSSIRPDDLMASVLKALLMRNEFDVESIEDIIIGDANQAGEDCRNVARMAALLAGLPVSVAGNTVNRLCGSGMQSVMDAARAIMCGEGLFYVAGGVESMTRAPFIMPKTNGAWSRNSDVFDSTIGWRFTNKQLADMYYPYSMGETAENVAKHWKISREDQDLFAWQSHQKYFAALEAGKWEDEMVGIEIENNRMISWISGDEPPRKTSLQTLSALKPAFAKDGTVTAGNSSGLNDGAAAVLLASEEALKIFNLQPLARITSMAVSGIDPGIMGVGPVPASDKALKRAGLQMNNIDVIELNEAFAATSLACIKELDADPGKININGGSLAIGNPLGSSGARIIATLVHELQRNDNNKYGLATMCVGLGQGMAIIIEKT
ncbi:thiolase family protein [Danxiaibacter flavus]|uniref:Thiolase family protein n=1 Tax=Danxiaibacter flavus TaxID=3049108 RepID=A0ABV3ZCQ8_9BACT|nr:thiolase family protein [Chitinophagaceae bacterium DXS]